MIFSTIKNDPISSKYWEDILISQAGGSMDHFMGNEYQRGGGFGSILKNIIKVIAPVAKKSIKALGKQAVRTGVSVARDALEGEDPLKSLEMHSRRNASHMLDKMMTKRPKKNNKRKKKMKGGGRKKGKTKTTRRRRRKIDILS